jgi:hypothetical protein
VAMSGDGRRSASASEDQTLKAWDLETGAVIATFTCDAAALCCAFAGGRKAVASDASGRVRFLSLELQAGASCQGLGPLRGGFFTD